MNIMDSIKQFGEPGFVFVESTEHTTNPCVEIGMFPQIGFGSFDDQGMLRNLEIRSDQSRPVDPEGSPFGS